MSEERGLLIVFEGIDGCGKSTQARRLLERLKKELPAKSVLLSREPTQGPWGRTIRETRHKRLPAETELGYFTEDRREHAKNLVLPHLRAGSIVLLDRYYYSTAAYQGARGIDPHSILKLQETLFVKPDLTLVFDLDVAEAIARIRERDGRTDAFETTESLDFCAAFYRELKGASIRHIDARWRSTERELSERHVADEVWSHVRPLLGAP